MHYITREIRSKLIVMFSGFVFYMEEERDQKYEEKFTNSVVLILKKALKIYQGTANNCWSRMFFLSE